jgi:hypothetical protein
LQFPAAAAAVKAAAMVTAAVVIAWVLRATTEVLGAIAGVEEAAGVEAAVGAEVVEMVMRAVISEAKVNARAVVTESRLGERDALVVFLAAQLET